MKIVPYRSGSLKIERYVYPVMLAYFQDTETKLKDALAEIKRLKSVEDEVSSLRTGYRLSSIHTYMNIAVDNAITYCQYSRSEHRCGEESIGRGE